MGLLVSLVEVLVLIELTDDGKIWEVVFDIALRGELVSDNLNDKADAVTKLRYISNIGAPDKIRTRDPQIRSLLLYPAELLAHNSLLFHRAPINNITSTKSWQANNRDFLRVLKKKRRLPF